MTRLLGAGLVAAVLGLAGAGGAQAHDHIRVRIGGYPDEVHISARVGRHGLPYVRYYSPGYNWVRTWSVTRGAYVFYDPVYVRYYYWDAPARAYLLLP